MFGFKKKVNVPANELVAPADGQSIALEDVKDDVFSKKMMGDGIAFTLSGNKLVAPCAGTVSAAFPGGHAYGIKMTNDAEVLIHFGLETVGLHGKGITPRVKVGDKVSAGDLLAKLDMRTLKNTGLDLTTMVIITNTAGHQLKKSPVGATTAGVTPVATLAD
jgi:glucose-specific phosphotransferase system IIA component